MPVIVNYKPPSQAEWRRTATGTEIRAALLAVGGKALAYADSISPRRTGEYASSFKLVTASTILANRWRAAVRLENTSGHALLVENRDGHHVFRRTLEYLAETGK